MLGVLLAGSFFVLQRRLRIRLDEEVHDQRTRLSAQEVALRRLNAEMQPLRRCANEYAELLRLRKDLAEVPRLRAEIQKLRQEIQ